jgi:hypothetical protein
VKQQRSPFVAGSVLARWFWIAIAATLVFRVWAAWWLPITGDEAYFIYWGEAPDLGYYDHPPMVGWLLAALLHIDHAKLVLRLPAILLPALIALGMAWAVRALAREANGRELGYAAALAWLLVPAQVLNVAITTDTPLQFFTFVSLVAYALALRRESAALLVLAGVALGLALLSKYFAALLAIAYLAHAAATRRWRGLAIVYACAAPFVLVNLAWNYEHCWSNLLFNLYNRHAEAGFAWRKPALFIALAVYVSSPLLLWALARDARVVRAAARDPAFGLLAACAFVPLAMFAALSPFRNVGLHWLLSFIPPLFMVAALALGRARLAASAKFLAGFSALHVAAVVVIALLPLETWQRLRQYDSVVMTFRADDLLQPLRTYQGRYVFAADGYTPAVTLSYNAAEAGFIAQPGAHGWRAHYFVTFGPGSAHARHDDLLTDFRALDGRDILVVRKTAPEAGEYAPYFREFAFRDLTVRGATFHLVLGQGFDFAAYRARVLADARDRYYRIPAYLPQGGCYFCERYFNAACPTR